MTSCKSTMMTLTTHSAKKEAPSLVAKKMYLQALIADIAHASPDDRAARPSRPLAAYLILLNGNRLCKSIIIWATTLA